MAEGNGEEQTTGAQSATPDVFISYASQDAATANAVVANLEQHALRCWIAPRDVMPGEFYADAIVQALDAAKAIVLILSRSATISPHVLREVERASSKKHPVISFRIDAEPLPAALEYFLNLSQWLDASGSDASREFPRLVDAVSRIVVRTAGTMPTATRAAASISAKSVAVLPFVDMSEKRDQEYFADGLSEELINLLTKIPDMRVPARTSSFYFKGKSEDIPTIAKKLMVAHVLEGSVRKSGDRLRVTAQLVRADTGYHLWSETYNRRLDDVFAVQDDIAGAVVKALKVTLLEGAVSRAAPTSNMDTYTLYLQARAIAMNFVQSEDIQRAIDLIHRALKLDPNFARAWATLARYRAFGYEYFTTGNHQQVSADARSAAERALMLDPKLADAHLAMAQILFDLDWDWGAAESEIRQALALDPGSAEAFQWASAIVRTVGRFDEALQLARSAVALDPLDAWNYGVVGHAYWAGGRVVEAERAYRQALDLAPRMAQLHIMLGWLLVDRRELPAALTEMEQETDERYREVGRALTLDALGRKNEADQALAIAEARYADAVAYPIAVVYAHRNDLNSAFAWLDRAYERHDGWVPWVPWSPLLRHLKGDPRWKALLRRINLPD